jgi:hypothetical protein
MADRSTNHTTGGEPSRNPPGEVTRFVRAMVLRRQDNGGGYPGAGQGANSGTHDLAISLVFVSRAAGDQTQGRSSHQVQT